MKNTKPAPRARRLQILDGARKDPYRVDRKPAGATRCPECGAINYRGRWRWGEPAAATRSARCPACTRIRDGAPAGVIALEGPFVAAHRREILARVRACEAAETALHPMQRIIAIEGRGERARITTTDNHLARRIGEALRKSYKGTLSLRYARQENLLRVSWTR